MKAKILGIILTGMLWFVRSESQGQSYAESALLFSQTMPAGSARIQGMGGVQVALGGDYSVALSNPAGLGLYNRSEVTFSPGFLNRMVSSAYFGNSFEESSTKLYIPGLSYVFHMPKDDGNFIGGSFAITHTVTNDFNSHTYYEGDNDQTSMIDYFIDRAFGFFETEFQERGGQFNTLQGLAYNTFLIGPQTLLDPLAPADEYFTDVGSIPFQKEDIVTSGKTNQWSFSYGMNYKDKYYFGFGLGLSNLRYASTKLYDEDFTKYSDPFFNYFTLKENLKISGTGLNFTIGTIIRPIDQFQIGLSFTTPTFYNLTENYDANMTASWKNFDYYGDGSTILSLESAKTDVVVSEYRLLTPLKLNSGATFIWEYGIVSADIEYTNPRSARYSSKVSGVSFSPENDDIKNSFKATLNYRLGTEFRFKIFRVRAGYSFMANAFSGTDGDNHSTSVSGGIGIRLKNFHIDWALVSTQNKLTYVPYLFDNYNFPDPRVDQDVSRVNSLITVGFSF